MALTHERIEEIASEAGYNCRDYSGRGMNRQRCVAITSDDSLLQTISHMIAGCSDLDEASEMLRTAKHDSMGLGLVLYWPRIKPIDDAL